LSITGPVHTRKPRLNGIKPPVNRYEIAQANMNVAFKSPSEFLTAHARKQFEPNGHSVSRALLKRRQPMPEPLQSEVAKTFKKNA